MHSPRPIPGADLASEHTNHFFGMRWAGCSGSTAIAHIGSLVLAAHGRPMYRHNGRALESELLKAEKNPYYNATKGGWVSALRKMHTALQAADPPSYAVVKVDLATQLRQNGVGSVLRALDTPFINGWRWNSLDRIVCLVRDCFRHGRGFAWPVNGSDGRRSDLCFKRRRVSREEGLQYKAFFADTSAMIKSIREMEHTLEQQATELKNAGFAHFANLTYEGLTAFEHASWRLESSVRLWCTLLHSWQVPCQPAVVRTVLSDYAKTASWPTPPPHAKLIYNADEVRLAMRKADPRLLQYFRSTKLRNGTLALPRAEAVQKLNAPVQ